MSGLVSALPTGKLVVVLDFAMAAWVAACASLGIALGLQVSGLRRLSGTVSQVGGAVERSGQAISGFGDLPVVGSKIGDEATQIERAGRAAVASARESRHSEARLSWMLALAIALIPSTPVLGLYLPARVLMIRERRALRRLWARHADDPEFRRLLARRALSAIPYTRLARIIEADIWGQYAQGRWDELAQTELDRWGAGPGRVRRTATRRGSMRPHSR